MLFSIYIKGREERLEERGKEAGNVKGMCCQALWGSVCQSIRSFPAPVGLILPVCSLEELKSMEMMVLGHHLPHHGVRAHSQRCETHPNKGTTQQEREDKPFHQLVGRKNLLASG